MTTPNLLLTHDHWTVIARSASPGNWHFTGGWSSEVALAAAGANEIVLMHRKFPDAPGWQLVARLAGPAWRRWLVRGRPARVVQP